MSLGYHRFNQKTNEIFLRVSALASKMLNQKLYYVYLISLIKCLHFFDLTFLDARAEILNQISLVF